MKKILALVVLSGVIAACNTTGSQSAHHTTEETSDIKKNKMENQEIDYNGSKMWLGEINEDSFKNGNYPWYDQEYQIHNLDTEVINEFKSKLQDFDIEVFMGTWCSDSQRETPAFFKIMDAAGYPDNRIKMYALDGNKKSPYGYETESNVHYVPTFIFYKNGTEVGRIVESPINTLEEDIRDIVNGMPQTPNYAE